MVLLRYSHNTDWYRYRILKTDCLNCKNVTKSYFIENGKIVKRNLSVTVIAVSPS